MRRAATIYLCLLAALLACLAAGAWGLHKLYQPEWEALFGHVVETRETRVQNLYVGKRDGKTYLFAGSLFIRYNVRDDAHPYRFVLEYPAMLLFPTAYVAEPRNALVIGLAAGAVPAYLHRYYPDMDITCVDFDDQIPEVAEQWFGFQPDDRMRVVISDGRVFLAAADQTWDIIIVDAFSGMEMPFHMATREFLELVRDHLAPGGVMAMNTSASPRLAERLSATFHEVFGHYDAYRATSAGNRILVAGPGCTPRTAPELAAMMRAAMRRKHFQELPLPNMFRAMYETGPRKTDAPLLTDDYAPVNLLVEPPSSVTF